jgi:hypothetical protein
MGKQIGQSVNSATRTIGMAMPFNPCFRGSATRFGSKRRRNDYVRSFERAIAALQKLLSIPYEGALAVGMPLTPRCSGSIRCLIRFGMMRASRN